MRIILIFLMFKMSLFGSSLKVGENAPDFILNDQYGKQHQLSDYQGKKLVIYFSQKHSLLGELSKRAVCAIITLILL